MSQQPVTFGKRNLNSAPSAKPAAVAMPTRVSAVSPRVSAANASSLTSYKPPMSYADLLKPESPLAAATTSSGSVTEIDMMRFIGANWPKYRGLWEEMQGVPGLRPSFSPAAFFLGVNWLLYRKLYALAFIVIGSIIAVPFIAPKLTFFTIFINAGLATLGKSVVISSAMSKIAHIKSMGLSSEMTAMRIEKVGGTSWVGPIILGLISFALIVVFMGAILLALGLAVAAGKHGVH